MLRVVVPYCGGTPYPAILKRPMGINVIYEQQVTQNIYTHPQQ